MRPFANEPDRQLAAVAPLSSFAGTVVGILFSFNRMGTRAVIEDHTRGCCTWPGTKTVRTVAVRITCRMMFTPKD